MPLLSTISVVIRVVGLRLLVNGSLINLRREPATASTTATFVSRAFVHLFLVGAELARLLIVITVKINHHRRPLRLLLPLLLIENTAIFWAHTDWSDIILNFVRRDLVTLDR